MQFHGSVYRSDDAGSTWTDIASGLPSGFGFPLVVDAADPDSAYVIPLTADVDRVTPDGRMRVYETRDAGSELDGRPGRPAGRRRLPHGSAPGLRRRRRLPAEPLLRRHVRRRLRLGGRRSELVRRSDAPRARELGAGERLTARRARTDRMRSGPYRPPGARDRKGRSDPAPRLSTCRSVPAAGRRTPTSSACAASAARRSRPRAPPRGGAQDRHDRLLGPQGLDELGERLDSGGPARADDALLRGDERRSSSATAVGSRSTSATRSWPYSACRALHEDDALRAVRAAARDARQPAPPERRARKHVGRAACQPNRRQHR